MATINSRSVVDELIQKNGYYGGGDPRVVKIVQYNNAFDGGVAYGLIYVGEDLDRYRASDFIRNPQTIWEV